MAEQPPDTYQDLSAPVRALNLNERSSVGSMLLEYLQGSKRIREATDLGEALQAETLSGTALNEVGEGIQAAVEALVQDYAGGSQKAKSQLATLARFYTQPGLGNRIRRIQEGHRPAERAETYRDAQEQASRAALSAATSGYRQAGEAPRTGNLLQMATAPPVGIEKPLGAGEHAQLAAYSAAKPLVGLAELTARAGGQQVPTPQEVAAEGDAPATLPAALQQLMALQMQSQGLLAAGQPGAAFQAAYRGGLAPAAYAEEHLVPRAGTGETLFGTGLETTTAILPYGAASKGMGFAGKAAGEIIPKVPYIGPALARAGRGIARGAATARSAFETHATDAASRAAASNVSPLHPRFWLQKAGRVPTRIGTDILEHGQELGHAARGGIPFAALRTAGDVATGDYPTFGEFLGIQAPGIDRLETGQIADMRGPLTGGGLAGDIAFPLAFGRGRRALSWLRSGGERGGPATAGKPGEPAEPTAPGEVPPTPPAPPTDPGVPPGPGIARPSFFRTKVGQEEVVVPAPTRDLKSIRDFVRTGAPLKRATPAQGAEPFPDLDDHGQRLRAIFKASQPDATLEDRKLGALADMYQRFLAQERDTLLDAIRSGKAPDPRKLHDETLEALRRDALGPPESPDTKLAIKYLAFVDMAEWETAGGRAKGATTTQVPATASAAELDKSYQAAEAMLKRGEKLGWPEATLAKWRARVETLRKATEAARAGKTPGEVEKPAEPQPSMAPQLDRRTMGELQQRVLDYFRKNPGNPEQQVLADAIGVTPQHITPLMREMMEKGLLKHDPAADVVSVDEGAITEAVGYHTQRRGLVDALVKAHGDKAVSVIDVLTAAKESGMSEGAAANALQDLMQFGLLEPTADGKFKLTKRLTTPPAAPPTGGKKPPGGGGAPPAAAAGGVLVSAEALKESARARRLSVDATPDRMLPQPPTLEEMAKRQRQRSTDITASSLIADPTQLPMEQFVELAGEAVADGDARFLNSVRSSIDEVLRDIRPGGEAAAVPDVGKQVKDLAADGYRVTGAEFMTPEGGEPQLRAVKLQKGAGDARISVRIPIIDLRGAGIEVGHDLVDLMHSSTFTESGVPLAQAAKAILQASRPAIVPGRSAYTPRDAAEILGDKVIDLDRYIIDAFADSPYKRVVNSLVRTLQRKYGAAADVRRRHAEGVQLERKAGTVLMRDLPRIAEDLETQAEKMTETGLPRQASLRLAGAMRELVDQALEGGERHAAEMAQGEPDMEAIEAIKMLSGRSGGRFARREDPATRDMVSQLHQRRNAIDYHLAQLRFRVGAKVAKVEPETVQHKGSPRFEPLRAAIAAPGGTLVLDNGQRIKLPAKNFREFYNVGREEFTVTVDGKKQVIPAERVAHIEQDLANLRNADGTPMEMGQLRSILQVLYEVDERGRAVKDLTPEQSKRGPVKDLTPEQSNRLQQQLANLPDTTLAAISAFMRPTASVQAGGKRPETGDPWSKLRRRVWGAPQASNFTGTRQLQSLIHNLQEARYLGQARVGTKRIADVPPERMPKETREARAVTRVAKQTGRRTGMMGGVLASAPVTQPSGSPLSPSDLHARLNKMARRLTSAYRRGITNMAVGDKEPYIESTREGQGVAQDVTDEIGTFHPEDLNRVDDIMNDVARATHETIGKFERERLATSPQQKAVRLLYELLRAERDRRAGAAWEDVAPKAELTVEQTRELPLASLGEVAEYTRGMREGDTQAEDVAGYERGLAEAAEGREVGEVGEAPMEEGGTGETFFRGFGEEEAQLEAAETAGELVGPQKAPYVSYSKAVDTLDRALRAVRAHPEMFERNEQGEITDPQLTSLISLLQQAQGAQRGSPWLKFSTEAEALTRSINRKIRASAERTPEVAKALESTERGSTQFLVRRPTEVRSAPSGHGGARVARPERVTTARTRNFMSSLVSRMLSDLGHDLDKIEQRALDKKISVPTANAQRAAVRQKAERISTAGKAVMSELDRLMAQRKQMESTLRTRRGVTQSMRITFGEAEPEMARAERFAQSILALADEIGAKNIPGPLLSFAKYVVIEPEALGTPEPAAEAAIEVAPGPTPAAPPAGFSIDPAAIEIRGLVKPGRKPLDPDAKEDKNVVEVVQGGKSTRVHIDQLLERLEAGEKFDGLILQSTALRSPGAAERLARFTTVVPARRRADAVIAKMLELAEGIDVTAEEE